MKRALLTLCSLLSFVVYANAEVLWEQGWGGAPLWKAGNIAVSQVKNTHSQAGAWNASSYRNSNNNLSPFEITNEDDHGGDKKCLKLQFQGTSTWAGGSIDLYFGDPDVKWKTSIDPTGYQELYYSFWAKTPTLVDFMTGTGEKLWKGARFYAFDGTKYDWNYYTTDPKAEALSSHYFDTDSLYYKPVFFVPSFASQYMYWYAQYHRYTDPALGTSYPHIGSNDPASYLFNILNDGKWHNIQYHVKLNDVGQANSVYELFIDGVKISSVASNLVMRDDPKVKIMCVMFFDNYSKSSLSGTQSMYIDDMVVSTTFIDLTYTLGPKPPVNLRGTLIK